MGYGSKNGSERKEPETGRYAKRSGFLTSYQIGSVSPMNGSESTAPDAFTCAAGAIYATGFRFDSEDLKLGIDLLEGIPLPAMDL